MASNPTQRPEGIWKDVVGYEGIYQVSNDGRIWSFPRRVKTAHGTRQVAGRVLQPGTVSKTVDGRPSYQVVNLAKEGCNRTRTVHSLVMQAFVGECPPGMEICHEDGNPLNNRLDNLRYDTHAANMQDYTRHRGGNRGERNGSSILNADKVREIRRRIEDGEVAADLAREFGVRAATISSIVHRRNWSHVA